MERGSTAAALVAGKPFPAAAPRRRDSNPVFQGPNQPGFGSGLAYMTCVIYLWPKRGSGRPVEVESMAGAGPRGVTSPASGVHGFPGATGYGNWRKGIKELGCSSPRVQVGRGGRAGGLASLTGGESRAALGVRDDGVRLRAPGSHVKLRGRSADVEGGSTRQERHWRRAIAAA